MSAPSWQDFNDAWRIAAQTSRPNLVIRDGDVTDALACGTATCASMIVGHAARSFRGVLVIGNDGDNLTVVAHDRGADREPAEYALGQVTFARPSAGAAGTILAGTRVATEPDPVTGKFATFTTQANVNFLAGDLSKTVAVKCTVAGSAGNVLAFDIDRIIDPIFSGTIQVSNAARTAGGEDEEADDDLIQRTITLPLVLRRGTRDALEYGAKLAAGVRRVSTSVAAGIVTLYVSDSAGNSNPALAAAAQAVIDGPPAWRAAGDNVVVVGASLFAQDVAMAFTLRAGANIAALIDRIEAAVRARMAQLQPGDTLYRSNIQAAAEAVDPTSIISATVLSPAADIVPLPSQIIRLGNFTY